MIVHLDADAFFASVEQAASRSLRGKAMAVGGMRRGIIASASYEARKYGVYTPMPTSRALRVCPHLIVIPGDFEKYEIFSRFMFSYLYDFTPDVEITSIDEGYFDLSGNRKVQPVDAAETIRKAIRQSLKIWVSEGIASNKLVSQIASKLRKPRGFLHVPEGTERQFLAPLDVKWLPGVGPKMRSTLVSAGLTHIGQMVDMPVPLLHMVAGGLAPKLGEYSRGIDNRPIVHARPAAVSYGHQETFGEDTVDWDFIVATLRRLVDDLIVKIREASKSARTISVKIRYTDMDETERSESFDEPSDLSEDFYPAINRLLKKAWDRRVRLRMVRVKLTNIYDFPAPRDLFYALNREKKDKLQNLVAEVQAKYGKSALMRSHDWQLGT